MREDTSQSDDSQITEILSRRNELVERIPVEVAGQERARMVGSIEKSLDALRDGDDQRAKEGMKEIIDILWEAREEELNNSVPRGERMLVQDWWECIFLNCGPRSDAGCVFRCLIFPKVQVQ